jgi:hypothetical protein
VGCLLVSFVTAGDRRGVPRLGAWRS